MFKQCQKQDFDIGECDINPDRFTTFEQVKDNLNPLLQTDIDLVFYFDFSRSNLMNQTKSLLHTDSLNNPYLIVLKNILQAASELDSDQVYHAYRFGCSESKHKKVVPLYNNEETFSTQKSLIQAYVSSLKETVLAGPTQISTCFNHLVTLAQNTPGKHFVAVIFANSPSQSLTKDFNALVQLSYFPVSVCAIGIGANDFDNLEFLDDCQGRKFDNFQFYEVEKLNRRQMKKDMFSFVGCKTFMEVPDQYARCQKMGYHEPGRKVEFVKDEQGEVTAKITFFEEFISERVYQTELMSLK